MESHASKYDAAARIKDRPEEMRPREELMANGAQGMPDEKLVAIILRAGLPGQNVIRLAEELLLRAGGLEKLSHMDYVEIMNLGVPGIGRVKAIELNAAFEVGVRIARRRGAEDERPCLSDPEKVYALLHGRTETLTQEKFIVCVLDVKNRLVGNPIEVATGANDHCPARPADIFKKVVAYGGAAIILAHNHPSGDPAPSAADISVTKTLDEGARLLGIKLLDHVVLGRKSNKHGAFVSMRREGMACF